MKVHGGWLLVIGVSVGSIVSCGSLGKKSDNAATSNSTSTGGVQQSGDLGAFIKAGKCFKDVSATSAEGDLNGDGKCDSKDIKIFLASVSVPKKPGDANGDGVVDKKDADQVMGAGKYNSNQEATWAQGDFNDDKKVDDVDLKILQANLTLGGSKAVLVGNATKILGDCTGDGIANQADMTKFTTNFNNNKSDATWDDCDFNGDRNVDLLDAADLNVNGVYTGTGKRIGDVNGDGKVDNADVVQVLASGKLKSGESGALWNDGDFDGDGIVDVTDVANLLANLEVTRIAGDANSDGVVNQADVELVMGAAKYDTGASASWGEGDFNFDGFVDILDLAAMLANLEQ